MRSHEPAQAEEEAEVEDTLDGMRVRKDDGESLWLLLEYEIA